MYHSTSPLLQIDTLRSLSVLKPVRSILILLLEWLVIVAAIYLYTYLRNPYLYPVLWLIVGTRMYALYSLLHDGLHYLLLRNKTLNDWVSRVFLAWPLFITLERMRKVHLQHHQHLLTPNDPEAKHLNYKEFQFPKSATETAIIFFKDITGINFIKYNAAKFLTWLRIREADLPSINYLNLTRWLYYGVAFCLIILMQWEWEFLIYWLIPYITIYQTLNRIRLSTEHFNLGENAEGNARTVMPGLLEGLIFSPHNLGYHGAHHLYPSVPFYRLPRLHKLLIQTDYYRKTAIVYNSYFEVAKKFIS